jgi:hypothetical protein
MVCKPVVVVVALEVQVVASHHQATPVTDSQAVAVLVGHQTSQALPPCTQVAVVVQPLNLAPVAVVAWAAQAVAALAPAMVRILLRVPQIQAVVVVVVNLGMAQPVAQVSSSHDI